jgi:glycosyltransferase involved in cell wall biosynthesis
MSGDDIRYAGWSDDRESGRRCAVGSALTSYGIGMLADRDSRHRTTLRTSLATRAPSPAGVWTSTATRVENRHVDAAGATRVLSYGVLSSSAPTPCGIATFTTALGLALRRQGAAVRLVKVLDEPAPPVTSELEIVGELIATDPSSIARTIEALNRCDVALVQHEYGLYGGYDGSDVIEVMKGLRVPSVAILHTVLTAPTTHQREVLNSVIASADTIVVMTRAAEATLRRVNDVGARSVVVVPHGAAVDLSAHGRIVGERPRLLTWGLIGPGKGIEWMIDAMVGLRDLDPAPLYVIAGRTHPKVLMHEGDVYRESLMRRVDANDVGDLVVFDNSYRDQPSLNELISIADVVVLPYDSTDQATSGVLVDAVAAGRPVVATAFPHAVELLRHGAGIVVPHFDSEALGAAVRRIITDPTLGPGMTAEARRVAPSLSWDAVARQYARLTGRLRLKAGAES